MATSTVEEFLGLRQQLKEMIRKRNQGNLSHLSVTEAVKKPQYINFGGSFFGPSEPTIAKRVIEESKGLTCLDLLMKTNKKYSTASRTTKKSYAAVKALEVKKKIQHLRMSRDYSFLNDDDPNHLPSNQASDLQRNCVSEKLPPAKLSGQRKSVSVPKSTSTGEIKSSSMDSKKQLGRKPKITTILPPSSKAVVKKTSSLSQNKNTNSDSKPALKFKIKLSQPPNNSKGAVEKKPTENISLNSDPTRKSNPKPSLKLSQPQPGPSSKLQKKKRVLENVSSEARNKQVEQSKKRKQQQLSENELAFQFIREAFNTKRFIGRDDRDVGNMEAKYGDILKEERRSAKLARKEDAEQLRLIEEEEAEERRRKQSAKRQKLHT